MPLSDIVHSAKTRAHTKLNTLPGQRERNLVGNPDLVSATLTDGGWDLIGGTYATAVIDFPLGLPISSTAGGGLDSSNRYAVVFGGFPPANIAVWYDPLAGETETGVRIALGLPPNAPVMSIGATQGVAAESLKLTLQLVGWDVVISIIGADWHFAIQSQILGTSPNDTAFGVTQGLGGSIGALVKGGGWTLQSKSQKDEDPTSDNDNRTKITVTPSAPGQPDHLWLRIDTDGLESYDWFPQYDPDWDLLATEYYALFIGQAPFHAGDIYVGNSFLYCGSFYVLPEPDPISAGILLPGWGSSRTLGIGDAFASVRTFVSGPGGSQKYTGGYGQKGFSFCYYHVQLPAGSHLQTKMGKSLILPALVMMPAPVALTDPDSHYDLNESRVVGYLWDAFIDTEYETPGTLVSQDEQTWRATFAQGSGAIATVFIEWAHPAAPPVPPPVPPPVAPMIGTGNVFGPGMTWVSGDKFNPGMVGETIYINEVPYVVGEVTDSEHLILTVGAGVVAGVVWRTLGS